MYRYNISLHSQPMQEEVSYLQHKLPQDLIFGVDINTKRIIDSLIPSQIRKIARHGIEACEIHWSRQVTPSSLDVDIKAACLDSGMVLTICASYDLEDPDALMNVIRKSVACGAYSLALYQEDFKDSNDITKKMVTFFRKISMQMQHEGLYLWIRPEISGRISSWGSLTQVMQVSNNIRGILPCLDFSHNYVRAPQENSKGAFDDILDELKQECGEEGIHNMHVHIEGIKYLPSGEHKHCSLQESSFKYKELLDAFHTFGVKGVVICKTPTKEDDALRCRTYWKSISQSRKFPGSVYEKQNVSGF